MPYVETVNSLQTTYPGSFTEQRLVWVNFTQKGWEEEGIRGQVISLVSTDMSAWTGRTLTKPCDAYFLKNYPYKPRPIALHSQAHNSVWQHIRFTYVSVVKSIYDVVCRTKPILANCTHVSWAGPALGDSWLAVVLPTSCSCDWLYDYPIAFRDSFVFLHWQCPLKLNTHSEAPD